MKLSVVIPVHNEASTIEEVLDKVAAVELEGIEKEIIVADDGSTDGSLELVQRSHWARADLVKVYASPVNFGKGAAVRYGFKFAKSPGFRVKNILTIPVWDKGLDPMTREIDITNLTLFTG